MDQLEILADSRDPLVREYAALMKQIEDGHYTDPNEIWDLVQRLTEAGRNCKAGALAEHLPDPCGEDDWSDGRPR